MKIETKKMKIDMTVTVTVPVTRHDGPGRPAHLTQYEIVDLIRTGAQLQLADQFPADARPARSVRIKVNK